MRRNLVPADLQAVNLSERGDTKCVVADEYIRRDEIYPLSVASMYQV